jgi:energy-coupling factor transporter ATP-binding protein EcfA2
VKLALAKLVEQTRQLGMAHSDDLDRMKSDILDAISKESESQEAALDVSTKLFEWTKRVYSLKKEQVILQSLRFDEMVDRRGGIVEAQPCTFEWVEKPKLSFLEWLSKDDGVYWVTGHPGSGKSTFMKYLSHHTKTHQKLVQWAAPKTLVTASFYFWFSGTALQMSQEGLLRSLLFQILRQCPCLIPRVCKSRWSSDLGIPWTRSELIETLKSLTLNSTSTKFFFLIDGLDEYQDYAGPRGGKEGGVSAHVRDIIEVINVLADLQDIKLCVSSRPWPAFENAFGQATDRKLYVHNENREDIGRNIRERFTSSPAYQKSFIPPKDLRQLSDSMAEDSRGAFLWVSLVVESLLQGLENGDRVDELRKRFEETPKTLHAMFERMLDSVEERYHEQAAQILQVAFHARAPMYVAVYSFIGDGDLLFEGDPKPWSEQDCIHKSRTTEDRLKVRCPDLIMIKGSPSTMTTA